MDKKETDMDVLLWQSRIAELHAKYMFEYYELQKKSDETLDYELYLKDVDEDFYEELIVLKACNSLMYEPDVHNDEASRLVLSYFVDNVRERNKIPQHILDFMANCFESYLRGEKKTLDLAFAIAKTKGGQKESKQLTSEIYNLVWIMIDNELDLMEAIEKLQTLLESEDKEEYHEAPSTETLRTKFHDQKRDALFAVYINLTVDKAREKLTDKVRQIIGEHWSDEDDVFHLGIKVNKDGSLPKE